MGLDLSDSCSDSKPPVAKIMDYWAIQRKKEKTKKSKVIVLSKRLKLSVKIAENGSNYK